MNLNNTHLFELFPGNVYMLRVIMKTRKCKHHRLSEAIFGNAIDLIFELFPLSSDLLPIGTTDRLF